MTWTCTIRDDVKWHDGEPLTSRDIAFTYRFILDKQLTIFADYLPYKPTFETPDDTTLIWHSGADVRSDGSPVYPDHPRAHLG